MLTDTKEDYIQAIYELSKENLSEGIKVADVAKKLGVARASAFKMTRNLLSLEYVKKDENARIFLTPEGVVKAEQMVQRFEIIKKFLQTHLKFDEEAASEEAAILQHVLSSRILEKMQYCVFYVKEGFMSHKASKKE